MWVMEAVGHAFILPSEDIYLMQSSSDIYQRWIFGDSETVPLSVAALKGTPSEQSFWIKIMQHYSLAFEPRLPISEDPLGSSNRLPSLEVQNEWVLAHIELCQGILKHLLLIIRRLSNQFSEETWLSVLKIFSGIADSLLCEPTYKKEFGKAPYKGKFEIASYMADRLAESAIRVRMFMTLMT